MKQYDIFISFSSENIMSSNNILNLLFKFRKNNTRKIAKELKRKLSLYKLEVFFDEEIYLYKKDFLEENIKNSEYFICLYSKSYEENEITQTELRIAEQYNKKIIFISIDGSIPSKKSNHYLTIKPKINSLNITYIAKTIFNTLVKENIVCSINNQNDKYPHKIQKLLELSFVILTISILLYNFFDIQLVSDIKLDKIEFIYIGLLSILMIVIKLPKLFKVLILTLLVAFFLYFTKEINFKLLSNAIIFQRYIMYLVIIFYMLYFCSISDSYIFVIKQKPVSNWVIFMAIYIIILIAKFKTTYILIFISYLIPIYILYIGYMFRSVEIYKIQDNLYILFNNNIIIKLEYEKIECDSKFYINNNYWFLKSYNFLGIYLENKIIYISDKFKCKDMLCN